MKKTETRILLVRYDEIGLKGKNRKYFENRLVNNIRRALKGIDLQRVRIPRGRILIDVDRAGASECVRRLGYVPGIASISVGIPVEADFDTMAALGVQMIEPRLQEGKSLKFCVRAQRSDKSFPKTSPEINFEVGSRIMKQLASRGLSVSLTEADCVLEIEVGHGEIVLFEDRFPGLRGLPAGSSGEVLCLLSGGIDSPVAAHMMVRRGCRAHFIFFDNQPFLGRGGYDKVLRLARIINRYQGGGRIWIVPFQDVQVGIRDHCRQENRVVLYRRMMYRIAHAVAEQNHCLALVTGESLGQVASQTLENLAAVSCVVPVSVFRPLIGMSKLEIIDQAKKIETYDISIEPQADCCSIFMPEHPVTRSRIADLEDDEKLFPWQDLMREALGKMEMIRLDELE